MRRSRGTLIEATLLASTLALPGVGWAQASPARGQAPSGASPRHGGGSSVQSFGGGAVGTSNAGAGGQGVPGAPGVQDRARSNPAPPTPARAPAVAPPEPAGALPPAPRGR